VPCGELASRWEDSEIVRLEMEEIDSSLEERVAVRGLRISEGGLVSAISSFLRFLGTVTESEPDLRSVNLSKDDCKHYDYIPSIERPNLVASSSFAQESSSFFCLA
jgi:hypothetical protein